MRTLKVKEIFTAQSNARVICTDKNGETESFHIDYDYLSERAKNNSFITLNKAIMKRTRILNPGVKFICPREVIY